MRSKQSTSHEAAMSAAHKYPVRNAGGEYEFKVTINGEGGDRRLIWGELKDATAAFLR